MIRTVLFDMGNVLLHFSHEKMCRQMGALCGLSEAEMWPLVMDSGLFDDFERGDVSKSEFHRRFEEIVQAKVDRAELLHAVSDIFQLNESMVPVVESVKRAGCRLVLLSNTNIAHYEFAREHYPLLDSFDAYALSYEARSMKPDRGIYEWAFRLAECAPDECFFTDDREENIAPARELGWHAEPFKKAAETAECLDGLGVKL